MGIFDLSRVLAGTGMNHHVITASAIGDIEVHEVTAAGRPEAKTEGQEQFVNVIIKSNSNGQAGVAWLAFLKRIGVKPTPIELTAPVTETNATGKRYCYIDAALMPNASIFILCEYRPDRAVHERPIGYAGLVHVIVFDTAKMKFGAIRSALRVAARTGVPAVYARKSHADNVLDQAMKNPGRDVEAIVRKQAYDDRLHNETMKAIRELRKGSIPHEELSDLYNAKKSEIAERWKQEGMLPPADGGEATASGTDALEHTGFYVMFDVEDKPEQNPWRSDIVKYKGKYVATKGVPKHGDADWLMPDYPLGANYSFRSLSALKHVFETEHGLKLLSEDSKKLAVDKMIVKGGKKRFIVFVTGHGWFQWVSQPGDLRDGKYVDQIDQMLDRDNKKLLTRDLLKKIDYEKSFTGPTRSEFVEEVRRRGLPVPARFEATAAIHFKTSSERAKQRRLAKLYRQKNKSKIKLKAKAYRKKMKHKKPNALRSRIAKLIAKHYHRG